MSGLYMIITGLACRPYTQHMFIVCNFKTSVYTTLTFMFAKIKRIVINESQHCKSRGSVLELSNKKDQNMNKYYMSLLEFFKAFGKILVVYDLEH